MYIVRPSFLGIVALSFFWAAEVAYADHISEPLFKEVFEAVNIPVCLHTAVAETDCDTLDPVKFQCWREKLHLDYDEAMLLTLLEEAKASNEKYPYFNEPYYNEFFSDRNWGNLMDYSDKC